jgi:hypothetical protein
LLIPQFKSKFEDTFTAPSLQVPWYICAGNHDYYGGQAGIDAEIQYTNKSKRWVFEDFYFSKDITMKDGTTITLLSVDTWTINGGDTYVAHDPITKQQRLRSRAQVDRDWAAGKMHNDTREVLIANFKEDDLEAPLQVGVDTKQLDWIAATLKASTADWKFVLGHFPVHSITTGEHGDTASLIKQLQPVLEAGGADGYWSGHDHILQHIVINNLHYFGSGAGGQRHTGVNTKYPGLTGYAQGQFGFMTHNGTKTALTSAFVSCAGVDRCSTKYSYTFSKVPTPPPAPTPKPPPPTPAPPTPAPPPGSFTCHKQADFTNPAGLPDHDGQTKVSVSACQKKCGAAKGCAVINWHATTGHCHTLTGAISAADYDKGVASNADYETCRLNA